MYSSGSNAFRASHDLEFSFRRDLVFYFAGLQISGRAEIWSLAREKDQVTGAGRADPRKEDQVTGAGRADLRKEH